VESSFDRRLSVYLRTLVPTSPRRNNPRNRGTPTLGELIVRTAIVGMVLADHGARHRQAGGSLLALAWDSGLPRLRDEDATTSPDGARHGYASGPEEQRLRLLERTVDLGEEADI